LPDDVKLVVAGGSNTNQGDVENFGDYGTRVRDLIGQLGVRDRVIFTGKLDISDLRPLYSGARITLVPSVWIETFGCVTLESLACETPVIVTRNCGSAECVDDRCGRVIPRKDSRHLADTILNIWEDAIQMGIYGRRKTLREHNWEATLPKILDVFSAACPR
jgi:glycosyltransferase involved in cell wall biosynthesis